MHVVGFFERYYNIAIESIKETSAFLISSNK